MTYLLSQLWFCLLLAWMLGNIVGWLLRGGCSQHIKRVEKNWRSRYLELEKEKEANFRKLKKLMVVSHDRDSLSDELVRFQGIENSHSKLKMRLATVEKEAKESQAVLRMRAQNIVGLQNSITTSKKIIDSKDEALKELTRKLKESINQIRDYKSKLLESNTQKDQSLKALTMKLNKSDAINVSLNTKLKETSSMVASELEKAHEELAKKVREKQQEVEKVITELDQARKQMAFCREQLEEADVQNSSLTEKLSEGNARMDILANEFAKMASQLNNAKAEVAEKRESSKKLELVGVKLKEAEVKLAKALDKGSKQEAEVAAIAELRKELELVRENLKNTEEKLSKALAKNTKKEVESTEITESDKKLELVELKLKETERKLSKALDKNIKHKAKINKISVKLDSSRLKLVDAHKLLQENQKTNSQNSSTDKEIESRNTSSESKLNGKSPSVQPLTSKDIDSGEWPDSSGITGSQKSVIEVELKQSKHKIKKLEAETVKNQVHLQKLELLVQSFQQTEIDVDDSEVKDRHLSGNFKSVNLLDRKKVNNLTKQEKAIQRESTEVNCEIEKIRGIGPGHGMRLRKLGITTNQDLLHKVSSSKDVRSIADKLSRKPSEILSWKKMADFLRIKGVSAEFAKLLELSSINSTKDIADSNATVLAEKMSRARKKERRIHNMPDDKEINDWISHARTIEPTDD